MFFRQLLNEETACASYLFGCKIEEQVRRRRPHVDLVDDYIAAAAAQGDPDRRGASRPTFRPTMSPDCPTWSSARERPPTCPPAPESSSSIVALADGEAVKLGNTDDRGDRDPGPCDGSSLLPRHGSPPRGGALVRPHRGRAAGRRRRAPRPSRPWRSDRRGDGAAALPLADRAAADAPRSPRPLPRSLLGFGLRPRPLSQSGLDRSASSGGTTPRSSSTPSRPSSRR